MAEFSIAQIPGIIDAKGWTVAAALLRRWFAAEPNAAPEKGVPCLDLIKMDWVLGFERAKAAYQKIFDQGLWKSANAKKEMTNVLKRRGLFYARASTPVDRKSVRLPSTHADHIQFVGVGGGSWEMATAPIDHLTAALARFNLHVVALGGVEGSSGAGGRCSFTVTELGVYVRDSYDFNDEPGEDQELGRWDPDDKSVGRSFLSGGTIVRNSAFRKWRSEKKKGGDYLIFSDVRYTALARPETLILEG